MTREAEWTEEQREWMLQLAHYKRGLCPGCGGHQLHTRRKDVGRNVEEREDVCLDCKAIDEIKAERHKIRKHTKTVCDCEDISIWVESYGPLNKPKSKPKSK